MKASKALNVIFNHRQTLLGSRRVSQCFDRSRVPVQYASQHLLSRQGSFSTATSQNVVVESNVDIDTEQIRVSSNLHVRAVKQRMLKLPRDAFSARTWKENELLLIQHSLSLWMESQARTTGEKREKATWCSNLLEKWIQQVAKQLAEEGNTDAIVLKKASLEQLQHYWIRTIHLWKFEGSKFDDVMKAMETNNSFLETALQIMPQPEKQVDKSFASLFSMLGQHSGDRVTWSLAEDFLEQWLYIHDQFSSSKTPDLIVWTSFLNLASKMSASTSNGLERFLEHWDRMIGMGVKPDDVAYSALLLAWARSGRKDAGQRVQELLEASKVASSSPLCYNISIDAWGRSGEPDRGEEQLWKILQLQQEKSANPKSSNNPTDYSSFLAAIQGWSYSGRAEAIDRAERLVDWMQKLHDTGYNNNLKPDGHIYSAALLAWSRVGSEPGPKVERLLRQMTRVMETDKANSIDTSLLVDMYEIAIMAWANTKSDESPGRALALLDEIRNASSKDESLRSSLYDNVIRTYTVQQHPDSSEIALSLLRQMEEEDGVQPSLNTYNAVMRALGQQGLEVEAEYLLKEMKFGGSGNDSNINPDSNTYGSLLYAYTISENAQYAEERCRAIIGDMEAAFDAGDRRVRPNSFSYSMLIRAVARASTAETASEVLSHVEERHLSDRENPAPDTILYNAILGAWAYSREGVAPQRAQSLLNQMKNTNREESLPSRVSYKYAMLAWLRSGRKKAIANAEKLCEELVQSGLASHDEELIVNLFEALSREAPDPEEYESLMKDLS